MHIDYTVTFLGVRGLDSSVNIMGCVNKMLVIEENVEFSIMNGFMNKYMHIQQVGKLYCIQIYFFFQIILNAV